MRFSNILAKTLDLPAFFYVFCVIFFCTTPVLAATKPYEKNTPFDLLAKELSFDEQSQIVTAFGEVEIEQNGRIVRADVIQYDLNEGRALALGNVTVVEPSGDVLFAEYMELESELAQGFIEEIQILLTDDSRFAALQGSRFSENEKRLLGAVFSPCKICEDNPDPIWQLRAEEIIHDEKEKNVIYHNAYLDFLGVPIFYTPYLRHPDPSVERRSGVLAPSYSNSGSKGTAVRVPYYQEISNHQDILVEPIYVEKDGLLTRVNYRHNLPNGFLDLGGSAGDLNNRLGGRKRKELRWHIDSEGLYEINDNWRLTFDLNRTSDTSFLRRYEFGYDDSIRSDIAAEYFDTYDYGVIKAQAFQGLRPGDNNETTANVAPNLKYSSIDYSKLLPGRFFYDIEQLNLERQQGADSRRSSISGGYEIPLYGVLGQLVNITAEARGDFYDLNDVPDISPANLGAIRDDTAFRFHPSLKAKWSWPFARRSTFFGGTQIIEPIVQGVVQARSSNEEIIPNEDSQSFEFDDTNLFSSNRFSGIDRLSEGNRVDYGIKMAHYGDQGLSNSVFIGQSYRDKEDNAFNVGSGVEENLSDVVGAVNINQEGFYNILYRFRFDSDAGEFQRNEVYVSGEYSIFEFDIDYIGIDNTRIFNDVGRREEISGTLKTQLWDNWSVRNQLIRDIEERDTRRWSAGLIYEDECFNIAFDFTRDFTDDGETEPSDTFGFTFGLKYLGGPGFFGN